MFLHRKAHVLKGKSNCCLFLFLFLFCSVTKGSISCVQCIRWGVAIVCLFFSFTSPTFYWTLFLLFHGALALRASRYCCCLTFKIVSNVFNSLFQCFISSGEESGSGSSSAKTSLMISILSIRYSSLYSPGMAHLV